MIIMIVMMIILWGVAQVEAYLLRMPRYLVTWHTPTGCVMETFEPYFRTTLNPFETLRMRHSLLRLILTLPLNVRRVVLMLGHSSGLAILH